MINKNQHLLKSFLKLGKYSVILPVGLTSFTGYYLFNPELNIPVLMIVLGVLLLGMSASALNQLLEEKTDSIMERTKQRPLPAKELSRLQVVIFIIISFGTGSFLLLIYGNLPGMLIGWFTFAWYNIIYTPLKKITAFAVIPGSLTGALPPVIGWCAAGGHLTASVSIALGGIFFMGQIPHFWLLTHKYGEQYNQAGLPSLSSVFSNRQINNLSLIWTVAALIAALLLSFFYIITLTLSNLILLIISITAIILSVLLISRSKPDNQRPFILLNLYYLLLMFLLIFDKYASQ